MPKNKHVIIAGGKTGGHLIPGIAVAQALMEKDPSTKILFVGTSAPFETDTLARYGFAHKSIIARPIKGKNIFAKAWSASLVGISLFQALTSVQEQTMSLIPKMLAVLGAALLLLAPMLQLLRDYTERVLRELNTFGLS